MDRFCYGIKWLYRSACHHILTAYFDDIAAMAMGHMTGLDICRVLRFCPYYYRRAPAIPLPSHRFPPLGSRTTCSRRCSCRSARGGAPREPSMSAGRRAAPL